MEYTVTLPSFDGPLDLLLHLIKQSDINICDISIVEITKQYLEYIEKMEEMNLDIASEYLVMAAELVEMKSKVLLPKTEEEEETEEEWILGWSRGTGESKVKGKCDQYVIYEKRMNKIIK